MKLHAQNIELNRFPALPHLLAKLLRDMNDENLNVRQLAELLKQDAALTLKVLSIANSPLYRRKDSVSSIETAVNLVGLKMVVLIAVSVSTRQFFHSFKAHSGFSLDRFWQNSLTCAFLSRAVARKIGYPESEEAYIAGLLHDIGQLALLGVDHEYGAALQRIRDMDALSEYEVAEFGCTHAELGAALLDHWNLEPLVAEAVRYHHAPLHLLSNAIELVKIVAFSNFVTEFGMGGNSTAIPMARTLLNLSADEARQLVAETHAQVAAIALPLGVSLQNEKQADESIAPGALPDPYDKLGREVQEGILLSMSRDMFSQDLDETELLARLALLVTVLYEPRQVFVFEWDSDSNLISGRPLAGQSDSIGRIRFPLEPNISLVADAMLWGSRTNSLCRNGGAPLGMIDQQVIRLAETESICCVPIYNNQFMFGVLCMAFPAARLEQLRESLQFLGGLTGELAATIQRVRGAPKANVSPADDQAALSFEARAKEVMHEVSNPLTILKNYLLILDLKLEKSNPGLLEIKVLNEEIDRISGIIRKLAAPDAGSVAISEATNLNELILDVVSLFDKSIFVSPGIVAELGLDPALPAISTNRQNLKQVLVNLFKNAAEAMQQGGVLKVVTSKLISSGKSEAICISVQDSGPGIPQNVLENLFTPVHSTKDRENAGLGLAITSGLVKELGGTISCRSVQGVGTSFDIVLPYAHPSGHGGSVTSGVREAQSC